MWPRLRRRMPSPSGSGPDPEPAVRPRYVVGDIHGQLDAFLRLLRDAALVDSSGRWSGGDARLWLVGDLVDRGPDGIGAVELVRRLQEEGDVQCLLGNHELLLLAASRFPDAATTVAGVTFRRLWELNGGLDRDLERLTPDHVAWLESLPSVARDDETLIVHADSDMYLRYGETVDAINASVRAITSGDDRDAFYRLLVDSTDRHAFAASDAVERMLGTLGGGRIVHGHTPISILLDQPAREVTEPLVYAGGRCVNVDHGLFLGGPGFVTDLSRLVLVDEGATKRS